MRVNRLRELFGQLKIDAILITDKYNMNYFSGYTGGEGYILVTDRSMYIFTDSRYIEQASLESTESIVYDVGNNSYSKLVKSIIDECGIKSLGFENLNIGYNPYFQLNKVCTDTNFVPMDNKINVLRCVKSNEEIELIRRAEAVGDKAYSHILDYIIEGVSERDIAVELEYFMKKSGADGLSFDTIVASGSNSSMPHAMVTDKKISAGDFVTMDFGCIYKGYCSDMTRTVALSGCSKEQENIYDIVLEAQEEALSEIKPGIPCNYIDSIARDIISDAGYGEYFGHGLGHGVGLYIHEEPRFSPKCDVILEPNMIITVEPGIYLPGKFGVRIEDLVVVTEDGYENLTNSYKELTII